MDGRVRNRSSVAQSSEFRDIGSGYQKVNESLPNSRPESVPVLKYFFFAGDISRSIVLSRRQR
jgi:hypothetical protein